MRGSSISRRYRLSDYKLFNLILTAAKLLEAQEPVTRGKLDGKEKPDRNC
jgi:hypothetical protein